MIIKTILAREFAFKDQGRDIKLADPDKGLSPEAVLNFYSNTYPQLVTAKIEGPEVKDDKVCYSFISTVGTKG